MDEKKDITSIQKESSPAADKEPAVAAEDAAVSEILGSDEISKKKRKMAVIAGAVAVMTLAVVGTAFMGGDSGANTTSGNSSGSDNVLFAEGLLAASTGGKWGYIDQTGTYVINPQFDSAERFAKNGLALVSSGGKYGYIDKTGAYVINPQFDYALDFTDNGLAWYTLEKRSVILTKRGLT